VLSDSKFFLIFKQYGVTKFLTSMCKAFGKHCTTILCFLQRALYYNYTITKDLLYIWPLWCYLTHFLYLRVFVNNNSVLLTKKKFFLVFKRNFSVFSVHELAISTGVLQPFTLHWGSVNEFNSPTFTTIIKSNIMTRGMHVAHVGERRGTQRVSEGGETWKDHLEYLGVDERMILKWILKKLFGRAWTDLPPDGDNMWTIVTAFINSRCSTQREKFFE